MRRFLREGMPTAVAEARATELIALWRGLQMTLIISTDPAGVDAVQAQALEAFCARTGSQTVVG